ncbi:Lrp/AsnC family transcriptional regulator [Leeia sp. TBRC 13508]|uniref:Lrp/AsnC family transcriptional regulator n=1 Tax=Leeia speluncae TaxID=2884804 RepID=A0ABS8DA41_9NEIS|nr:Lrp/AsnC family transcriptional regulator [Leeia speluncae]MCB6185071.1 Lrp/AsnC family transcriptional regulator [Leeia speluncae]
MDDFDRKLLGIVQKDALVPQNELGEAVHLSTTAVNRRLKKMSQEKIIDKIAAVVNPESLGYNLTIIVEVEAQSEQINLLDAMKKSFLKCPQVQQCYYVTGECDFVLIMLVRNMDEYTNLTRALFFENNNVKKFKTLVAMNRVKVTLDVPVD